MDLWTFIAAVALASLPAVVTGLFSLWQSQHNSGKIEEIHMQMNGELAKRIALEVKTAFAEGEKSEKEKHL